MPSLLQQARQPALGPVGRRTGRRREGGQASGTRPVAAPGHIPGPGCHTQRCHLGGGFWSRAEGGCRGCCVVTAAAHQARVWSKECRVSVLSSGTLGTLSKLSTTTVAVAMICASGQQRWTHSRESWRKTKSEGGEGSWVTQWGRGGWASGPPVSHHSKPRRPGDPPPPLTCRRRQLKEIHQQHGNESCHPHKHEPLLPLLAQSPRPQPKPGLPFGSAAPPPPIPHHQMLTCMGPRPSQTRR